MSSPAIKFENISKQYRLGTIGTGTLSHDLNRWWAMNIRGREDPYLKIGQVNDRAAKAAGDYIWALRDIDFEVKQGEVLGIIGKNGAGKSTLLKILSRVTTPTIGRIMARGRIASLLEVGTGFHPEMTGRENIFMNGSIMGMTKAEIRRKFDEIVDFAGVEKYIDTPVKRYSSGMTVRLGFAIAAHLEPEILVVDEVLAVGDAEFQKKAVGKMQDVSQQHGRTVLFVSHNMGAVSNICDSGIVLNNGELLYSSTAENAISKYLNLTQKGSIYTSTKKSGLFFRRISAVDNNLNDTSCFGISESPRLSIEINDFSTNNNHQNIILGVVLLDDLKNKVFTVDYDLSQHLKRRILNNNKVILEIPEKLIAPGNYSFLLAIHKPNVELF
ncbi:MAG: polysaccharide ABC transporter ATP-binding protein, partial [Bacteroidales bacterium]|nr:polysaccharide ABC transporter ATP-binding protein [Bacteroidales bacterium]